MTDRSLLQRIRTDASTRAQLEADVSVGVATFAAGDYELVTPWPHPPGPNGPLVDARNSPAHGAYVCERADELVLWVVNNGWPIDVRRCPGPNPGSLAFLDPTSAWLSQQDTLVGTEEPIEVISPGDAAFDRVIGGHKPLAMADTVLADEATLWRAWAESAGMACKVDEWVFPGGGERVWFVTVARPESFGELVDLDAVGSYYESALPSAGRADLVGRVLRSLTELQGSSPAEFVERTDDLIVAPFGDDVPDACRTEVAGIVMGYWPPTSAAFMLSVVDGTFHEPRPEADLRGWDAARFGIVDEAEHQRELVPEHLLRNLPVWSG